jgi:hypothetical protein
MYKELKNINVPSARHFFVVRDLNEDLSSKYKYPIVKRESQKYSNNDDNENIDGSVGSSLRNSIKKSEIPIQNIIFEQKGVNENSELDEDLYVENLNGIMEYLNNPNIEKEANKDRVSFPFGFEEEKVLTGEERQLKLMQELENKKKARSLNLGKKPLQKSQEDINVHYDFGEQQMKSDETKLVKEKSVASGIQETCE